MPIINGMNNDEVHYFNVLDYANKIELKPSVIEHVEETNRAFDEYFKKLLNYDSYSVIYYLIDSFYKEIVSSHAIENHYVRPDVLKEDVFYDSLNISHNRVNQLHEIVTENEKNSEKLYRKVPVRVSRMTTRGEEIFWRAPNPEDVKPFMDDYIKLYKTQKASMLYSNPFLVSALMQLVFIRIHPYNDGNGRTARLIHNIKFTESINKLYGMKLKICPLNISGSILINKPTYANRLDNIYFDLEHDNTEAINKWFEFILNMNDEQIFYNSNRIKERHGSLENIAKYKNQEKDKILQKIDKMHIKMP